MATVQQILEFLRAAGATHGEVPPHPAAAAEVHGVSTDGAAGPGEMSWLSPRAAAADPERARRFGGTLLICPEGVAATSPAGATLVECRNPKIAFIRVLDRFFGHLAEIRWPDSGRDPEARLGERVRLGPGVVLGPGTVIGDDVVIGPGTCLAYTTVGARTRIGCNCSIGLPGFGYERDPESGAQLRFPHMGRVAIGQDVEIGSNTCVDRGSLGETRIADGVKIDNLVHVAHNVEIGENSLVIAHSMLGGSARIGRNVWVAPSVSILNQLTVGEGAVLGMGSVVIRDVAPGATIIGNPGRPLERRAG